MKAFKTISLLVGLILVGLPLSAVEVSKKPTADEIAKDAFERAFVGLQKGTATIQMDITPETSKSRTLSFKAMHTTDGLLRYLIKVVKPASLAGMSYLALQKKDGFPDQYMYTPSDKVVSQVAAGKGTSSFFGSPNITYADLGAYANGDKEKVELKLLDDTKIKGEDCYVLQITIKDTRSPYSQIIGNVRKSDRIPVEMSFYDQSKALLKTLTVLELGKVASASVPVKLEMKSVSGSKTVLTIINSKPDARLSDSDFTTDAMQR